MKEWRTIKRDIQDAMSHVESNIEYDGPHGGQCSAFTVTVYDEDYDPDDFYNDLEDVSNEWNLSIDDWYHGDDDNLCVDLYAYWDD